MVKKSAKTKAKKAKKAVKKAKKTAPKKTAPKKTAQSIKAKTAKLKSAARKTGIKEAAESAAEEVKATIRDETVKADSKSGKIKDSAADSTASDADGGGKGENGGGNGGGKAMPEETSPYPLRPIANEMQESYLDYAMSVIVSRALPDVRDGLKPVHRRILFAMHELGLTAAARYRKSAAVVGDVLGKYHPHGDTAVYDSMVRMAQDFSLRYLLVDGQGNFGSIDGDSAAAMRYTETRMTKLAEEMLKDIERKTVEFRDNYDGTRKEPSVLPSKLPQLLLNGVSGIAVGMATSIPPHNLIELTDAIHHLADNPKSDIEDLLQFIKGPDFPTGGIIYDKKAIQAMYVNGRGGVTVRAKTEIEERKGGKFAIIVNEIPYQVNKSQLVAKIAELVQNKKIIGISDIRDESNREGISVVIELKRDSYPKKILNQLFKYTQLQSTFNMNMIALVDGIQPRLLNLKQVLEYFISHRREVITKRTKFDLDVAKARAHILEGLKKALDHIDEIIQAIKKSATKEDAHKALMQKFKLSDKQATAILEMKLQTLAGLERKKIEDELKEKRELIKELESILKDPKRITKIMKDELSELKDKFGDERKTKVVAGGLGDISLKDTVPNEPMVVTFTRANYIKRMPPSVFRTQHRGGKGVMGMMQKEEDEIDMICHTRNHESILFFTNKGRVFRLPVFEIPQASRMSKGQAIVNLLQLQQSENVTAILNVPEKFTGEYLIMCTKSGTIKKTAVADFENVRRSGLIAIRLRPDDSLEWVKEVKEGQEIFIATRSGQSIRFNQKDVREMGRASQGVRGIALKEKDEAVEMDVIPDKETNVLIVMENGLGKTSKITDYRIQRRGGSGIKTARVTPRTGKVIAAKVFQNRDNIDADLICISKKGQTIRLNLKDIPTRGRATQGVYVMRLKANDKVASVSLIIKGEEDMLESQSVPQPTPGAKLSGQKVKESKKQPALL